ncbi:RagB/SusD family nutrient uptake outer membrane protein [Parabacteroides sp. AF17-28]|jgi:hypothetical protein|uniref:RagB/SusD family nutrient uptake outer membrane protein n=1 Tax=Parabacteroides sp. AF17-28 TaxID=2292241 RepID=UPI000EFFDA1B|nr:RagB/SusD family nutrient uptake outer membrane protein [Parabacteroides sp. AF17-28]RHR58997.1 RagB/SusD family nutrient uptake outer membrane protein [Parabacteroides sp. AF17-28]
MKRKIFNYILASICILGNYSCSSFLEEKMVSGATTDYYQTEEGMETLIAASYANLRFGVGEERVYAYQDLGTDCFTQGGDGNLRQSFNRYESTLEPTLGLLYSLWQNNYKAINATNTGIEIIPQMNSSEEFKNRKMADLRFLRANFYFELVQQFGPIPINTEAIKDVKTDFKRSPVADVYKLIINDLRYAVDNLPETGNESGYATTWAASHLLAKVYLTRGSAVKDQRGQQPSDMDSVIYYTDKVIKSGRFALENEFTDLFDINNRKSQEFIFSVQFSQDEVFNGNGNQMHMYYVCVYENFPGMTRDIENGRSWKRLKPTDYVFNELFDHKNDSRFYKSFQWVYKANNPSTIPAWEKITDKNGNVIFAPDPSLEGKPKFAQGDTAAYFIPKELPLSGDALTAYCAAKPYTFVPINNYTELLYPTLIKWLDPTRPDMQYQTGSRNWVKMRFSETYLMAAEAYGRKNDFAKAAEYINIVRARAAYKEGELKPAQYWTIEDGKYEDRMKSTQTEMMVTPSDISSNFIDFMLDERGREFLGEACRWEDLVRCEKLIERVKKYNVLAAPNIKEYHKLRPIPQNHIDRLDPQGPINEEQNEGYY